MESFRDYFKKAAIKAGGQNKLGVVLGITGSHVSIIMMGGGGGSDEVILKLADFIGEDPAKLFILRKLDRCTENTRPYWKEVLKRYASVALILLCTLPSFMGFPASKADASTAQAGDELSITGRTFGTPLRRWLRRLIEGLSLSDMTLASFC